MTDVDAIIQAVKEKEHPIDQFRSNVARFFETHPELTMGDIPSIHSVKSRLKNCQHLREKLNRKIGEGRTITPENIFFEVTDLGGVRVLHLHQKQFQNIHSAIDKQFQQEEWFCNEDPKAYTWDPESKKYFESLGLKVELKDSYYTSVHYTVRPRQGAIACCEIQVRTLFEEIWGEIDHTINYPKNTEILACSEQLRVLAKLVATGSRLADSIFRTYSEDRPTNHRT